MRFQIERIVLIQGKIYLFTKCLSEYSDFKLSDYSLLGGIEIENWVDIPRSIDENGNQRPDNFAFVIKNQIDQYKIKPGEVLILSERFVNTVESFSTVSGKIGVILECGAGKLEVGTGLTNSFLEWRVLENNLSHDTKFQTLLRNNFWFQYYLEGRGHDKIPIVGYKLTVQKNGY